MGLVVVRRWRMVVRRRCREEGFGKWVWEVSRRC